MKYVATLKYDATPDYDKCRHIFENGLKKLGEKNSGELIFNVKSSAGPSKKEPTMQPKVGATSPKKRMTKPAAVPEPASDAESEVENQSPKKVHRKRVMTEDAKTPTKDKRAKISTKINQENTSSSKTGSMIVINDLPDSDKTKTKKSKTLHLNLELDVSIDANIVLSVKRKSKKNNVKSESQSKTIQATYEDADDDEDVIPNSNENTPVAKVRVTKTKKGTAKTTQRKSPRSAL